VSASVVILGKLLVERLDANVSTFANVRSTCSFLTGSRVRTATIDSMAQSWKILIWDKINARYKGTNADLEDEEDEDDDAAFAGKHLHRIPRSSFRTKFRMPRFIGQAPGVYHQAVRE